jgi:hypothetical protein
MAVPAALMSITRGMPHNASSTTLLSSQSETLSIGSLPPLRARITKALLLILLLAGNFISARKILGANIRFFTFTGSIFLILRAKLQK